MMWGQSGGRSFIRGKSPIAWALRLLILAFLIAGVIAVAALVLKRGGEARAQVPTAPANPIPSAGGAIIFEKDKLPHAFEAGWKGEKVCEILQDNDDLLAARCTFAPGVGHEKHWHGPHFGYIVEGARMRITDDKGTAERDLKSGASWWSEGTVHEAVNIGGGTAVYIIIEPKQARAQ